MPKKKDTDEKKEEVKEEIKEEVEQVKSPEIAIPLLDFINSHMGKPKKNVEALGAFWGKMTGEGVEFATRSEYVGRFNEFMSTPIG